MKERATHIESYWQRKLTGAYPIRVFAPLFLIFLFALLLIPVSSSHRLHDLVPTLGFLCSLGVYLTITFLVWEKWDYQLVGKQWIEEESRKPRSLLLLIVGQYGLVMSSLAAMTLLIVIRNHAYALPSPTYKVLFIAIFSVWVVIGILSTILTAFPISESLFGLINSGLMPDQIKRNDILKRGILAGVIILVIVQIIEASPNDSSRLAQILVYLLIGTSFLSYGTAGLTAFMILWLDSISKALKP